MRRWLFPAVTFALLALSSVPNTGQGQPPAKDLYGDLLPAGAIARLSALPRWQHDTVVAFAAFLPDGKSVITVSQDGLIHHWEYPSGRELRRIPAAAKGTQFNAAALAPDGKTIVTSFQAPTIVFPVDPNDPFGLGGIGGKTGGGGPGGKKAGKKAAKKAGADTGDFGGGSGASGFGGGVGGFGGAVQKKAAKKDTAKDDGKVEPNEIRVFDLATGKVLPALKTQPAKILDLAFSPDGRQLTVRDADGLVRVWDWAATKVISQFAGTKTTVPRRDTLAYSPDGKTLMFFGLTKSPRFVDTATGKEAAFSGEPKAMVTVWFTADGKEVVTQREDGNVQKWGAAGGKEAGKATSGAMPGSYGIVSPDGRVGVKWSASTAKAGGKKAAKVPNEGALPDAVLFDVASGKELGKILGIPPGMPPSWVMFSPDSKLIAIRPFDGKNAILLFDAATAKLIHTLILPKETTGSSTTLANALTPTMIFSPDSKVLAYQKNIGATAVVVFDVATGKQVGLVHHGGEHPVLNAKGKAVASNNKSPLYGAFSADGRCLAVAHAYTVTLYELATGQPRWASGRPPTPGEDSTPAAVDRGPLLALSPDGKLLARACFDGVVQLLDTATGKELAAFKGHSGRVNGVAFAPNAKTLASVSSDSTGLIWDVTGVKRPVAAAKSTTPADLDRWWAALASSDAAEALSAITAWTSAPKEAAQLFKDKVKPASGATAQRIDELIFQLDDNQFKARYQATSELLQIGEQIIPALEKALASGPSLEMKRRLEELRSKVSGPVILHGEALRAYRAVEVLERIATPDARSVLEGLAQVAPGAPLTVSAQAALKRL